MTFEKGDLVACIEPDSWLYGVIGIVIQQEERETSWSQMETKAYWQGHGAYWIETHMLKLVEK